MSYLSYISDENLINEVKKVLDIAIAAKNDSLKKFNRNVIDPFSAIFETTGFMVDHKTWKESEMVRQSQKTLQNHIGNFHQRILGHVNGWEDMGVGAQVDLKCQNRKIIAEVKNKFSTVSLGSLGDVYRNLESLVTPKTSSYKGYTVYFVNIIPKSPKRTNAPFTPSDKTKGQPCPSNELIRIIDGASFYDLVTEEDNALQKLFEALPNVIEHIYHSNYGNSSFKVKDKTELKSYFASAYLKK